MVNPIFKKDVMHNVKMKEEIMCDADANTLRTSVLGVVLMVAKYCAPVWLNSPFTTN